MSKIKLNHCHVTISRENILIINHEIFILRLLFQMDFKFPQDLNSQLQASCGRSCERYRSLVTNHGSPRENIRRHKCKIHPVQSSPLETSLITSFLGYDYRLHVRIYTKIGLQTRL